MKPTIYTKIGRVLRDNGSAYCAIDCELSICFAVARLAGGRAESDCFRPTKARTTSRSAAWCAWSEDNKMIEIVRDTVSVERATEYITVEDTYGAVP